MANRIYNVLGQLQDRVLRVKLCRGKDTLVAQRLWPDIVAVGQSRRPWQLARLKPEVLALLDRVDAADAPLVFEGEERTLAKSLGLRLLAYSEEIHAASGRHVTGYQSWSRWSRVRGLVPVHVDEAEARLASAAGRANVPW